MKIIDRLAFLRAGYTKDEINKIIEDEKVESTEDTTANENKQGTDVNDFMSVITTLADEVKNLKKAVQKENIENTTMDTDTRVNDIDKILASVINPEKTTNKEE